MKLIGSRRKGKHAASGYEKPAAPAQETAVLRNDAKKLKERKSALKKAIIIASIILALLIVMFGSVFAIFRWEIDPFYNILFPKPKDLRLATARTPRVTIDPDDPAYIADPKFPGNITGDGNQPANQIRNTDKITILLLGVDGFKNLRSEGGANTDVIMIVAFDMGTHEVEVVSIPRDTLMNVSWNTKKANSIYMNMMRKYSGESDAINLAMEDTKEHFADFLGFNVDFWVMLDMEAFVSLVNAMPGGGVLFNVPREIHMIDPDISLDVHLYPGEQLLNGRDALGFIRYRSYGGGDFTRIEMQQLFLKAAAEQLLSGTNSIDPVDYANIFIKYVKTDIELTYLARIGRELLKTDSSKIGFDTAPSALYSVPGPGGSYVRVLLDEWLEIVNEKLNPFYYTVTPYHVSIFTLDENKKLYVTDDHWQGSRNWPNN